MLLRYNHRVYPTPGQQIELARAFGCARVVFNDGLRARQEAREQGLPYVSDVELSKRVITQAKLTPERAWLGEVSAVVLQQAPADLNTAYRNFFASVSGKRKGREVAPPRFRSRKDNRQAIRFTKNARFKVLDNGKLRLPKIGDVAVRRSRSLPSDPSSVAIIKDAAGRYFASFVVRTMVEPLPPAESEVGIDLGLTHFAVLSDGTKVAAPKFLRRAARKFKRLQQALSRKQKGSANRYFPSTRMCSQCGRIHEKMALNVRAWGCPCGAAHDRDVNAASNVLAAGRADNSNDRGARVRPPAMVAPRGEAVTHPDAACSTRSVEGIPVL
ncbi:transposase [Plantactinospora sp. KLBMP9567]|uniref:RNA-guided endonuclease InsQ/TnpB family protein n=1 Tax=Plantactinospora sp. KLBMP9567 TaxID=3085900 RepID=UPI002981C0AE|nr:transposase [Plantactinospora sp. KLBMP9567]MDW5323080.1 transposase [Plantactinospora sp. KLBMP9567]